MGRKKHFAVWSIALYFSWVLAFPYYGIVFLPLNEGLDATAYYCTSAYLMFHALGYLAGALFLKKTYPWKYLMSGSLVGTIAINLAIWFSPAALWVAGFSLLGFISSFYVLGWSHLYRLFYPADKVHIIVHMAVRSNIIAVLIIALSTIVPKTVLMAVMLTPLLAAGWLLISKGPKPIPAVTPIPKTTIIFPSLLMLVLCLFFAAFKLSAGFMYRVIHYSYPVMDHYRLIDTYYHYIPFIFTLVFILHYHKKIQRHFLAFAGIALLGLSFVTFALAGENLVSFILTTTLIEAAFALLNVFSWTLLGDLSSSYGSAHRFFGFGLFAILFGTFTGGLIGEYLLLHGDSPRALTALYATAAIFLTLVIIPWFKEKVEDKETGLILKDYLTQPLAPDDLLSLLFAEVGLTAREKEVSRLLLEGLSNKEMAGKLFISENTLKTHLRNIYRKFGVSKRNELINLMKQE